MSGVEKKDEALGADLSERERQVLEAVVRTYVETAEPAGSRTVSRGFALGISPATVRNTMSDLEEKGYLFHPHTSAGRIPTDQAYRFFVDRIMEPAEPTPEQRASLERELGQQGWSAMERLILNATRALSLISNELGVAVAPRLSEAVLESIELIQVSSSKVLLVATIRGGVVRTVYVDLPIEVPPDTLVTVTVSLNERLAGLSLQEIRRTLPQRLRDSAPDETGKELINIFIQSGAELFDFRHLEASQLHLGPASVLASQPEFGTGERLKSLIDLTEQRDLLAQAVGNREHAGRLRITIGAENASSALSEFTLVTAEYSVGGLKGVIGVIGPTRMPYEKVVTIVDYTSSLVSRVLAS
ncbi:MAG TPA: heat-inducible transcriptional repressor HrcA [Longimicrobiales bacterium]|nr:heat-inducible transcriptional repressor HrcA [Longimicrobiales bacterium]